MATSGRKKAEKKPISKGKRYEDGSVAPPSYKAATPTGSGNRSGVAKKAAVKKSPNYLVKDSASASDFSVERFYRNGPTIPWVQQSPSTKKTSSSTRKAPRKGTGAPYQPPFGGRT